MAIQRRELLLNHDLARLSHHFAQCRFRGHAVGELMTGRCLDHCVALPVCFCSARLCDEVATDGERFVGALVNDRFQMLRGLPAFVI